jgi:tungstate transport system substrate-binding protein
MQSILPAFEAASGAQVEVIGVGTGEALALGQAGDVDVVLVHDRVQEDAFVQAGFGVERHDVMYNDFVLLGPAADPADVATAPDILTAFSRIATAQAPFISRGDNSGTHSRELSLWQEAAITPSGAWYQQVGQGMGATLTIAEQQQGYTLSDRGTFLQRQQQGLELDLLLAGDGRLYNPYGIIAVNPALHANINFELAEDFIGWITGPEGQIAINSYRIAGQQPFFAGTKEQP